MENMYFDKKKTVKKVYCWNVLYYEKVFLRSRKRGLELFIREDLADRPVNGGRGGPQSATKKVFWREKDAECSEMQKYVFWWKKYVDLGLFYVLDYSGSFDMHIEKLHEKIYFFLKSQKQIFDIRGGGSELYGLVRN